FSYLYSAWSAPHSAAARHVIRNTQHVFPFLPCQRALNTRSAQFAPRVPNLERIRNISLYPHIVKYNLRLRISKKWLTRGLREYGFPTSWGLLRIFERTSQSCRKISDNWPIRCVTECSEPGPHPQSP